MSNQMESGSYLIDDFDPSPQAANPAEQFANDLRITAIGFGIATIGGTMLAKNLPERATGLVIDIPTRVLGLGLLIGGTAISLTAGESALSSFKNLYGIYRDRYEEIWMQ